MTLKQWSEVKQIVDTKNQSPFEVAVSAEQWNDILVATHRLPRHERMVVQLLYGISEQRGIAYSLEQAARVMKTHTAKVCFFQEFAIKRLRSMPILQKHVEAE